MDLKKLYDYIDAHCEEYIGLAQKYCRQPSVVATGEGMKEMILSNVKSMGFEHVENYQTETYPIIYASTKGKNEEKNVCIYNHYDVQPPEPLDKWVTGPYEAVIRDGKIFSRGIVDNKGSFAAKMCALDALKAVYGDLPLNIQVIVEGEEEIGSPHMEQFLSDHPQCLDVDATLRGSGTMAMTGQLMVGFGNKGLLYVQLSVTKADRDMHSMYASIMPSAAWRLVEVLSTLKDPATDKILIDGFYELITPATESQLKWMRKIKQDVNKTRENAGISNFINNLSGEALLHKWPFEPQLNICGITCGYQGPGAKTLLPNTASVKMDFRLMPGQTPQKVFELLEAHLSKYGFDDVKIDYKEFGPLAAMTNMDTPFTQIVNDSAVEIYGIEPDLLPCTAGTSPNYPLSRLRNQPIVSIGNGREDSRGHAPNENCTVENYINNIKMIAAVIQRLSEA